MGRGGKQGVSSILYGNYSRADSVPEQIKKLPDIASDERPTVEEIFFEDRFGFSGIRRWAIKEERLPSEWKGAQAEEDNGRLATDDTAHQLLLDLNHEELLDNPHARCGFKMANKDGEPWAELVIKHSKQRFLAPVEVVTMIESRYQGEWLYFNLTRPLAVYHDSKTEEALAAIMLDWPGK